jgi:hypothetical protein
MFNFVELFAQISIIFAAASGSPKGTCWPCAGQRLNQESKKNAK